MSKKSMCNLLRGGKLISAFFLAILLTLMLIPPRALADPVPSSSDPPTVAADATMTPDIAAEPPAASIDPAHAPPIADTSNSLDTPPLSTLTEVLDALGASLEDVVSDAAEEATSGDPTDELADQLVSNDESAPDQSLAAAAGSDPTDESMTVLALAATQVSVADESGLVAAINQATAATTVTLIKTINLDNILVIPEGKVITLQGAFSLVSSGVNNCITVKPGATLTLDGITVTNRGGGGSGVVNQGTLYLVSGTITGNADNYGGGVNNSGTFTMSGGSITGNTVFHGGGGGVSNTGTFIMTDGTISANTSYAGGGGVYCHERSTFTMSGGSITGNRAPDGASGGGVLLSGYFNGAPSRFTMTGGSITENTASSCGGGVTLNIGSEFILSGGEISGNSTSMTSSTSVGYGGGVYVSSGTLTMTGGSILNNTAKVGGGVYNSMLRTFTMTGGVIAGNSLNNGYDGGGIFNAGYLKLSGDARIVQNSAPNGAGIYMRAGTLTMTDHVRIADNTATGSGGGLYLDANRNVYKDATASILGGTFANNTAKTNGGAIWLSRTTLPSADQPSVVILDRLTVAAGVTFSNNQAKQAFDLAPEDEAIYRAQIGDDGQGVTWTAPYTQGYNNLDIGYTYGAKIQYFTVSFEGNGGSVLADDSTRSVRGGQALADAMPPAPERSQYIFTAWNSKVDGSGTEFTASTVVTANITLYAQWREQTYTVSYAPGDHGLFETITYPSLSAQTATPAPPLTPGAPGWVFAGWSPTPTATVDGDVTYVAQWRLAVYTVTFVDHDATELSVQQVEHGSNAILPANPVWVDYQFAGWNQAHTNVQNDLIIQALYARLPDVHPVEMLIVEVGQPEPGQAWPAAGDDQWTANADQPETSSPLSSPSLLAVPPAVLPTEPGPEVTDAENFSLEVSAELLTLDNLLNGGRVHEAADQQTDGTTWALFNLLLALLGLLLAAVIVGWKLLQRYRWSQAAPGAPAASWRLDALLRSGGALLALLLAAGLGLALFLVTADLAGPMVLVDNWTVLQLGSTLVVLGLALLTLRQSAGWKAWEAAD